MQSRVQCGLTAGLAIVGASVIAITPIASPTAMRAVDASAALMADFTNYSEAELVAEFGERIAEQFAQAPFVPLVLAAQVVAGDETRLFSQIRQSVDSPVYVADPLIELAANTLPAELGGGSDHKTNTATAADGDLMDFRNNELLGLRDDINAQFAAALGVTGPLPNENYAWTLAQGVLASGERTVTGTAGAPVGLIPIAQAMASGDAADLYRAIREYIDAPLWAADPAIEGLAQALPESVGGGSDGDFHTQDPEDGALMTFRNETLWGATHNTRVAVANVLDVDLDAQDNPVEPPTTFAVERTIAANSDKRDVTNLKPHFTSLNTQIKQANDRAEKRVNKVKENVNDALNGVRDAVESVAKKLTPKKEESKSEETKGDDS